MYLPIGDEKHDLFCHGIDATDGQAALNYGNYGILYKLKLPVAEKKTARFYLTPLGGVYSGAVNVLPHGENAPGKLVMTPKFGGYFGDKALPAEAAALVREKSDGDRAILTKYHELTSLGTYRGTPELLIEYSPPGASNLPVYLIMAPG